MADVDFATVAPASYDCVVIVTDHSQFDYDVLQRVGKVVVDTRDAIAAPGTTCAGWGATFGGTRGGGARLKVDSARSSSTASS